MLIKDLIVVFFYDSFLCLILFCGRLWDHNFNRIERQDGICYHAKYFMLFKVLTKYANKQIFMEQFICVCLLL